MSSEVELKLLFRPEDLRRVKNFSKFRRLAQGRAWTRSLVSTYFDTVDQQLRRKSIVLRVRKLGNRYIQGIKKNTRGVGGMISREELEWDVSSDHPQLKAIDDAKLRKLVADVGMDKLEPIFRVDVRRTSRRLKLPDATEVTVDIDVGEIVTPTAKAPICEVELELDHGSPHCIFDLAAELHAAVPLRLSTKGKAARGYALISGETIEAHKAPKFDLSRDITVEVALQYTVQHCHDHLLANEGCVLESKDPEGVHQMRIALRRLRSVLKIFRPVLPPDQYAALVGEAKWLAGELASARDWDVFDGEVIAPVAARFPQHEAFGVLGNRIDTEKARARNRALDAVRSERYTAFLLTLGSWLVGRKWRDQPLTPESAQLYEPVIGLSDAVITRYHKKVCQGGRAIEKASDDKRHRLRIDVKKLRYATDFFYALYPQKKMAPYADSLRRIQSALGHFNDIVVAKKLIGCLVQSSRRNEALPIEFVGGIVVGWHGHAILKFNDRLGDDLRDFVKCKPFWSRAPARPRS